MSGLIRAEHLNGPSKVGIEELVAALAVGQLDPEPEARAYRVNAGVHQILAALDPQIRRELLTRHRSNVDRTMQPRGVVGIVALDDAITVRLVRLCHGLPPGLTVTDGCYRLYTTFIRDGSLSSVVEGVGLLRSTVSQGFVELAWSKQHVSEAIAYPSRIESLFTHQTVGIHRIDHSVYDRFGQVR